MGKDILNLIDFEKVNLLLEGFNKSTGFVTAILDLNGNILLKSGWRQICTEFHRVHHETARKCKISDTELAGKLGAGEKYHSYKCLNGMVDVAVPIIIGGEHVANLFSGQFFFEKPDLDFFKKQAKKYKFDTKTYLKALDKVPVVSEEKVKTIMDFLLEMTLLISEMTMQKIKQIESNKALKESEERFRVLYNNSPDMYVSVSAEDGSIIQCNETLLKNLAYSREEIIGAPIYKIHHEKCLGEVKNVFQQVVETGEVLGKELILKRKDGSSIDVSLKANSIKDKAGNVLYSILSWRDISVQTKAINELKKEKQFLEAVFDTISEGIVSCDANGVLQRFNKATVEFHGLPSMQLGADKWANNYNLYFSDGNTPLQKEDIPLYKALNEGIVQEDEIMIRPKNGKERLVVCNGKVLKDTEGRTLGAVVAMHDITKQRRVQNELKENEEKYRALFDNAPLSYQSLDEDGRFIDINPSWLRTLGYERDEVIGKYYADFLHPDWKPHFEKNFPAFKKRGYVNDVQFKIKHKKGHFIDISFEGCIGYLPDGSFKQTYCVFQDITDRKQIEEDTKKNQLLLQQAEEISNQGAWEWDIVQDKWTFSENWLFIHGCRLSGITREELMTISYIEDATRVENAFQEALQGVKPYNLEHRIVRQNDREVRVVRSRGKIIFNDSGRPIKMYGIAKDITERKKAELALVESEEKFKSIFEQSPLGIQTYDMDGKLLSVNPKTLNLFGLNDVKPILGFNLWEDPNLSPENAAALKKGESVFISASLNFEMIKEQIKLPTTRKGIIYLDMYIVPLLRGNESIGFLVQIVEITERKEIEKELFESAKKYRDLVNMAQEGIWAIDKNNKTTFANPSMAEMLGYSPEEMIGKSLFDFMDEAGEKVANENLERRRAGLKEQHDFEFICKNGNRIFCALVTSPILDKTGKYQGAIAGIINITERKQFLKKLQERNEYIESVMENMPIGFALNSIDDGDVKYMNNRFEEIYGWSRDILTNTSIFFDKVFPDPEYKEKIKTRIIADMQSSDPERMVWKDLQITTSTGEVRFVDAYNIPLIDQNLMISTVQDTTKRKLAEDEIKRHRENLEELVKERTKNLDEKNEELERINKLFIGRELKMVELKEKIKNLTNDH